MTLDEHVATLRGLLVAEHERWIAEIQSWADRAAADGDDERQHRHLAEVERLRAIPYPWEKAAAA